MSWKPLLTETMERKRTDKKNLAESLLGAVSIFAPTEKPSASSLICLSCVKYTARK